MVLFVFDKAKLFVGKMDDVGMFVGMFVGVFVGMFEGLIGLCFFKGLNLFIDGDNVRIGRDIIFVIFMGA